VGRSTLTNDGHPLALLKPTKKGRLKENVRKAYEREIKDQDKVSARTCPAG